MVRLAIRSVAETVIGFTIGVTIILWLFPVELPGPLYGTTTKEITVETKKNDSLVFIGVMTAKKYIDSRALAVYETWGKTVPGKIMFFTSENTKTDLNIPVVPLKGVDDVYPPQKKSFMMLKYMHDNYINDYEWFMRVDDDVYIHTEHLGNFLRSVNSKKVQFLGQAGLGSRVNVENLGLGDKDNYCMGGPGMVFSKQTLKKVVPHIKECMQNLYTTHEDVEVGRCVRKYSNVTCTWAYEMQQLFYHNHSKDAYEGNLRQPEVLGAITLHPLKSTSKMYRIHNYLTTVHIKDINHKMLMLKRNIADMKNLLGDDSSQSTAEYTKPSLTSHIPETIDDIIPWKIFDKSIYDYETENPHFRMLEYQNQAIHNNIMDLLMHIQQYNQQLGRIIVFKDLLYGYFRICPNNGIQYVLDVLLSYQRYIGKKMTLRVRRHAYIQQTFLQPEIRDITVTSPQAKVVIILPLSGRLETFKRFLINYEKVCLQSHENIHVSVILFLEKPDAAYVIALYNLVKNLNEKYGPTVKVHELERMFSRSHALNYGAHLHPADTLLVFLDVDMEFDQTFLHRVRLNTALNSSVYFPVVYSQYSPKHIPTEKLSENVYNFDQDVGYWRKYGFGIVSIYRADFDRVSGFNENIVGWGMEDVEFVEKVIKTNLRIFRAADPGVVHVYHEPMCNSGSSEVQYKMCMGTKVSSLGSTASFVAKLEAFL